MNSITTHIGVPLPPQLAQPPGAAGGSGASGAFKNLLIESITQVDAMQKAADHAVEGLFTGADVNPAEVLTAVQQADLSFRMLLQVRNKLLQAYQEVKEIRI